MTETDKTVMIQKSGVNPEEQAKVISSSNMIPNNVVITKADDVAFVKKTRGFDPDDVKRKNHEAFLANLNPDAKKKYRADALIITGQKMDESKEAK